MSAARDSLFPLRDRLTAIATRQLDDRTLTPGEAESLCGLIDAVEETFEAVRRHGYCPVCNGNQEDGHDHDCALATASAEVRGLD